MPRYKPVVSVPVVQLPVSSAVRQGAYRVLGQASRPTRRIARRGYGLRALDTHRGDLAAARRQMRKRLARTLSS